MNSHWSESPCISTKMSVHILVWMSIRSSKFDIDADGGAGVKCERSSAVKDELLISGNDVDMVSHSAGAADNSDFAGNVLMFAAIQKP